MRATVVSVVGARPNFIKLAAVTTYFNRMFNHVIIHTGQHYDYELSKTFFESLNIPEPHYFLNIGSGSQGYQVGEGVKRVEEALLKVRPDIVVVYGDTNSTLAGALAAVKAGFKVAHVESGLRCYDMRMPEEVNRRVVDHVSSYLFAPTMTAVENLRSEHVLGRIYLTGDVHVDMLRRCVRIANEKSEIVAKLGLRRGEYVTLTVHRAENTDNEYRLRRIADIITEVCGLGVKVVFPIHPRTSKALAKLGLISELASLSNLVITKPLSYIDFIKLLKHSRVVITDSGGVQREAYLLKVPCLVLRDRTEWVELVGEGWVRLVDIDVGEVVRNVKEPVKLAGDGKALGDGRAGERIARIIADELGC